MYNSTPMPGEYYESAEAREKALREREAIANGESFNPYVDNETAESFASLGDAVPFAGGITEASPEEAAVELVVKDESALAAEVAAKEGLNLVGGIIEDAMSEEESYSDMEASSQEKRHDNDNAIAQKFNEQWDQGKVANLDDIQEAVERDYIDGAIEQSAMNPDAQADMANTERFAAEQHDSADSEGANHEEVADQPHDLAESAAIQAVSVSALSDELVDKIKVGDTDAMARISEVEQRAAMATTTASEAETATMINSDDELETRMAIDTATQAREKAADAIAAVEEAVAEYESMSDEEKEEMKAAAEAAEDNGTTVEEEKEKIEEAKDAAMTTESGFMETGAEFNL